MKKTIFITGASSGIGKATALFFQQKGWNVVATMRSPEQEKELNLLENVQLEQLDVLDLHSIRQAVANGIKRFGQIHCLVNNAGYGAYGPLESFPRDNIIKQFNTNVIGVIDVTRMLIPHFREQHSGTIVNLSSIGGRISFALGSLYHATKFAIEGFSESLQYEMAEIGVKVKIIEPGFIATNFGGSSFDFQAGSLDDYEGLIKGLFSQWKEMGKHTSPAQLVAEVIWQAVTDDTDQLRYKAGKDAEQLLSDRLKMTDEEFFSRMKQEMGI